MRLLLSLRATALAAVTLLALAIPSPADPADWVGKQLPPLGVRYLGAAPDLKGKPAIVEFWATWCPPCRKTIPHLNEIYSKYKAKGLNIIGISDEDQPTIENFRKTLPMDYTVAIDKDGELAQKFGIIGIPLAFVVDKSGKIVWQGFAPDLQESTVEEVMK